jgi:hypothetical protein
MSGRKAGDTVGYIPRLMQKRFLNYNIRERAAWKEIEAIGREAMKLFSELDREFNLEGWVYSIDNIAGKIELERHKTMQELKAIEAQRELIENGEEKVAK